MQVEMGEFYMVTTEEKVLNAGKDVIRTLVLSPALTHSVTLDKLLHLFVPQFPCLQNATTWPTPQRACKVLRSCTG